MAGWLAGESSEQRLMFLKISAAISVPVAGFFFYRLLPDSFSNQDHKPATTNDDLPKESKSHLFSAMIDSLLSEKRSLEDQLSDYSSIKSELQTSRTIIENLMSKIEADSASAKNRISDLEREIRDLEMKNKLLSENLRSLEEVSGEEIKNLSRRNEEIMKEIEKIKSDRCNGEEELVYMKWVNACLRRELKNYNKTNTGDQAEEIKPMVNEGDVKRKFITKIKKMVLKKESEENHDLDPTIKSRCRSDLGDSRRRVKPEEVDFESDFSSARIRRREQSRSFSMGRYSSLSGTLLFQS